MLRLQLLRTTAKGVNRVALFHGSARAASASSPRAPAEACDAGCHSVDGAGMGPVHVPTHIEPSLLDPVGLMQTSLEHLHVATHLPWWACIAGVTLALRAGITLPLAAYQQGKIAKLELLRPKITEWSNAIIHNVIVRCKREKRTPEEAQEIAKRDVVQKTQEIMKEEGVQLWKTRAPLFAQIPLWIVLSVGS